MASFVATENVTAPDQSRSPHPSERGRHNKKNEKGAFVKKDAITGRWVEVDEIFSREKVGQSLRDSLHSHYRSSTKAKKRWKTALFNPAINDGVEQVMHSNQQVSNRIHTIVSE